MAIKAGKATFWTALASGAGYLVLMAFFNAASPTPSVDYAALLNQKAAAVPESERAWLAYRDAWTKFKFSEGGSGSHFTEIFQKDEAGKQTSELIRPEDQGWAEAVEKLKASAELLDAFRAGAQLEHLGLALHADLSKYSEKDFKALFPKKDYKAYLADENRNSMGSYTLGENADRLMGDSIISVLLPHVQQFRQATRIFQVDTRLAVTENNPDRVVDDIKVILGFARQQKNESYLVCNLVGVALFKIGVAQIEEVIRENPKFLNQGQLTQLQNAVAKFDFSKIDFSGERAGQLDLLQRVYSDDGSGDGRLTPEGLEILTMLQQWQAAGDNTKDSAGIPWQRQSRLTRSVFGPALMISQPRRQEVANSIEDLIEEAETRSSTPWWEDNLCRDGDHFRRIALKSAIANPL